VVHYRGNQGVGVAHKIKPPKNQPQFFQMTMGQYWLDKTKPNKLSNQPEILSKNCYGNFKIFCLMEFSSD